MSGMTAALERLQAAIERKEKFSSTATMTWMAPPRLVILKTAIELCGGAADFHVPHRIRDGYGMKDDVVERASADGVRLIISVDTGIRAFEAADTARRMGIDLIVTDHHLPGNEGFTCCSSRPQSKISLAAIIRARRSVAQAWRSNLPKG